jgi:dipeptidyl aminopeptidase/acylaminoacyl peptidase
MMALAAMLAAGAARAAPLEAYGKLPAMDMVSISPDGGKIAFVQEVKGRQAVVIDQLNPAALLANVPPTTQKVRKLIWADPTHLLVIQSEEAFAYSVRREWYYLIDVDLEKRKFSALMGKLTGIRALTGMPEVRTIGGRTTVFAPNLYMVEDQKKYARIARPALMSVDLATGNEHLEGMSPSPDAKEHWILDDNGKVIAVSIYNEINQVWGVALHRGEEWAPGYSVKAVEGEPEVIGITPDGKSLVLQLYVEGRGYQFRPLDLAEGKLKASDSTFGGFSELIQDPWTDRIVGGQRVGLEPAYGFLEPKDQAAWDATVKLFPDEYVDFVSWSRDHNKLVVKVTGLRHGVVYELVDLAQHKATPIGQPYEGITPNDLADVRIATYPAKDGTPIKAFLTLPNGRDPKNLPLIVLPHGGPAEHDEAGFDWWAQALASRGYAVLQPQFRGSSLDWKTESAGFGEWGRKMQTDLSDGVRALASQGFIDPKRVCIVGASYGGYAALAGVTIEQGVYRCAVSVGGVSDLRKFVGGPKADADHSHSVRYWDRFMGAKDPKDPVLDQISPAAHAAQASAPVLLIHGKDDTVVPSEQSEIMERELRRANKPVEFVRLKEEDHWLSREATRTEMLQATVSFLEKNNPPK